MDKTVKFALDNILQLLRIIFGVTLLVLGLVGLVMPIMPGWIFVIIGLLVLGYKKEVLLIKEKIVKFLKYRRKKNTRKK